MLAARLDGGGPGQRRIARNPGRLQRDQFGLAFGQRAGLVEGDDLHPVRDFERFGVLDQDAVLRRHAGAGHDRRRRRQPQRARAGDHQHGDRVEDGRFPVAAGQAPAQQRDEGDADDHRHEHGADLIDQPLNRRFFRLRRLDHAHDARQRRFGADGRGAHDDQPFGVDRAAGHAVAGVLVDRQALAGDQRFVDLARAFHDFAIDRRCVRRGAPRPGRRRARWQSARPVLAVPAQARGFGPQRIERADGLGGLALGARFEPFAQQHQRDDDGRRLEVQMRHAVFAVAQQQVNAQPVGRRGADAPPASPCCRRRPERLSSRPCKSARRARTAPAWRAAIAASRRASTSCQTAVPSHRQRQRRRQRSGHGNRPPGRAGLCGCRPGVRRRARCQRFPTPGSRPCQPQR